MFKETDQLVNQFFKDAEDFVKKLKRIPVQFVESEYILGTQNGIDYHIKPSEER